MQNNSPLSLGKVEHIPLLLITSETCMYGGGHSISSTILFSAI